MKFMSQTIILNNNDGARISLIMDLAQIPTGTKHKIYLKN